GALTPDGRYYVTEWRSRIKRGYRSTVVVIDTTTGRRRTVLAADDKEYGGPVVAPDGSRLVATEVTDDTPDGPGGMELVDVDLAAVVAEGIAGQTEPVAHRTLTADWNRWPA